MIKKAMLFANNIFLNVLRILKIRLSFKNLIYADIKDTSMPRLQCYFIPPSYPLVTVHLPIFFLTKWMCCCKAQKSDLLSTHVR